jgi:hypothetical protein
VIALDRAHVARLDPDSNEAITEEPNIVPGPSLGMGCIEIPVGLGFSNVLGTVQIVPPISCKDPKVEK